MKLQSTYKVAAWQETDYDRLSDGMKLSRASVVYTFTGDLEGDASVEYLMFYSSFDPTDPHTADASYVGLMRFQGSIKGKAGSVVFHDRGTFHLGVASSALEIAAGSGTGELRGISGTGTYRADKSSCRIELECVLPP